MSTDQDTAHPADPSLERAADRGTAQSADASAERVTYRMCRAGTLLWKLPTQGPATAVPAAFNRQQKNKLVDVLCDVLNKDSRVIDIKKPEINPDFTYRQKFYPDLTRTDDESILKGNDSFKVMSLSDPIYFSVHVPKKNQPDFHGIDDIPSEDYYVAWDGVSTLVLWEQSDDDMPLSGGQIVTEILRSALQETHADLYVQACSPDCDNVFLHTSIHVYDEAERDAPDTGGFLGMVKHEGGQRAVDVYIPADGDDFDTLEGLYLYLNLSIEAFAELKNKGRRILDIEDSIRDQFSHLLSHYYDHASIAARPLFRSIRDRWRTRGWRKEARQLLARVWLSLANIEGLRRWWDEKNRDFQSLVRNDEISELFTRDYVDDVAIIESLDLSHLDSSIDQVSSSLDNRAIIMATVGGALAGGLAGALIGLIH